VTDDDPFARVERLEAEIEAERAKRVQIAADLAEVQARRDQLRARIASTPGDLPYDPGRREVTVLLVKMTSALVILVVLAVLRMR